MLIPLFQRLGASAGANEGAKRSKAVELMMDSTDSRYFQFINEDPEKREVWFKFKPTADGNYKFDFEQIDSEADYEIIFYKGNDELSRYNTEDIKSVELEKGKKYYVVISFIGELRDDTFSVSVSEADPKGAYRDDAYELVAGYNEGQTYASLTATYGNKDDGGKYGASPSIDGYGENYKFSHVYFKFTPTETTRYTFKPDVSEAYIRLYDSIDGSSVSYQNYMGGDGLEYALVAGTTYYYQVEFDGYSRQTSFAVTLEAEPKGLSEESAYVIQLGDNAGPAGGYESIQEEDYVWFKFTPAADGKYKFTVDNSVFGGNTVYFNLYERDNTWNDTSSSSKSSSMSNWHSLYTDYDYYVKISCDYFYMDTDFTIKVEKAVSTSYDDAIELTTATDGTDVSYVSNVHSGKMYFKFTPATAGFYKIQLNNFNSGAYLYAYEGKPNSDGEDFTNSSSNNAIVAELDAGVTYYFRASSLGTSYSTCQVYVTEVIGGSTREAAIELELGENEAQEWEALEDGYQIYFKFKPTTSDYYIFTLSDGSRYLPYRVYTQVSGTGYTSMYTVNGQSCYNLSSSQTYYLCYDLTSGYGEFGVNVTKVNHGKNMDDAIKLDLDSTISAGYDSSYNTNYEMYFKFTTDASGLYRVSTGSINSSYIYIYNSLGSEVAHTTYTSTYLEYSLNANATYYVKIRFSSSYDTSFNITVGEQRYGRNFTNDAIKLTNTSKNVGYNNSYNAGGVMWFEFTATSTSHQLRFSSLNSSYYTSFTLWEKDALNAGNVTSISGGTGAKNSTFTLSPNGLTIGETYYVRVEFSYSSSGSANSSYADTDFYAYIYS